MPNTRVHRVLEQFGSIVFPGVYDTLSARIDGLGTLDVKLVGR